MKKIIWNHAGEILSVIVALVLVLGMAGSVAAATRSNPQAPTDAAQYQVWLTQQVHHKLAMIPWYSVFDNLEYKVEGGKVILAGQVTRPVIKSDAESSVKGIEGVKEVVDEIEILPPSPMDERLRRQEYRSIYSFGPLERYSMGVNPGIHIIVKSGQVTLEGVVDSQPDKDAANIRAREVAGVFSVTNNLRVEKSS
ncbi:MAG: BON domain-containing protein [Candidatus Acidiferrales bacterium]